MNHDTGATIDTVRHRTGDVAEIAACDGQARSHCADETKDESIRLRLINALVTAESDNALTLAIAF